MMYVDSGQCLRRVAPRQPVDIIYNTTYPETTIQHAAKRRLICIKMISVNGDLVSAQEKLRLLHPPPSEIVE